MKATVKQRIYLGFLLPIALACALGGLSLFNLYQAESLATEVNAKRAPMVLAAAGLNASLQTSVASLRGWMILKSNRSKRKRAAAWKRIDTEMTALARLAGEEAREQVTAIKTRLTAFRQLENDLEQLVHTPENLPATKLLQDEAVPLAERINQAISRMIHFESRRGVGSRDVVEVIASKTILKSMVNFRGAFSLALADVRAFLLTGGEELPQSFKRNWARSEGAFVVLQRADLSERQTMLFEEMAADRKRLAPVIARVMEIRSGGGWNLARWRLGARLRPQAESLEKSITAFVDGQAEAILRETARLHEISRWTRDVTLAFLALIALTGLSAAWLTNRTFEKPHDRRDEYI